METENSLALRLLLAVIVGIGGQAAVYALSFLASPWPAFVAEYIHSTAFVAILFSILLPLYQHHPRIRPAFATLATASWIVFFAVVIFFDVGTDMLSGPATIRARIDHIEVQDSGWYRRPGNGCRVFIRLHGRGETFNTTCGFALTIPGFFDPLDASDPEYQFTILERSRFIFGIQAINEE
jgi:hypothetical protein